MAIKPTISQIFSSSNLASPFSSRAALGGNAVSNAFQPVTRTLPVTGQTYQSPVLAQPTAPVAPAAPVRIAAPAAPVRSVYSAPAAPAAPSAPAGLDYSKYTDPATGQVMSPQQYAEFLARRVTGGSIPNYAGNALTQAPQTSAQLTSTATDLNNQRNDIATGTTDPYKAASASGVAYSPSELAAIEKAYAGIYDPALKDVFAKLDAKTKEDAAAAELKNQLALQAQRHKDDLELKKTPSPTDAAAISGLSGGNASGGYVEGANPIVDSWVQRISRGEAKLADITGVKNQGLKNLVNAGLNTVKSRNATSSGNLDTVNTINTLLSNPSLDNISGFIGQTGITSLFGKAKTAKTEYDNILGAIQLAKAGQIKGQGAVSDYERGVLKAASAAIDRGQSDKDFKDALIKLRGALTTASGLEAPIRVTSPSGEIIESTGDTEEINGLIAEGNLVQYIQ